MSETDDEKWDRISREGKLRTFTGDPAPVSGDEGLKEQVRPFEENFSAFTAIKERFFEPRPAPVSGDMISREAAVMAVVADQNHPDEIIRTLRALPSVPSVTEEQFKKAVSVFNSRIGFVTSSEDDVRAVLAALWPYSEGEE